jgi:hypothetical protein
MLPSFSTIGLQWSAVTPVFRYEFSLLDNAALLIFPYGPQVRTQHGHPSLCVASVWMREDMLPRPM